MKTTFKTPFEVQAGDRVVNCRNEILTVTESRSRPTTIGGALLSRHGAYRPQQGDGFFLMMRKPDGAETDIHGRWDGESGFRVVAE